MTTSTNRGRMVFLDQYPFIGGGQTVLLNLIRIAIRLFDEVVLVAPTGGALEAELRARFQGVVTMVHIPAAELSHGRKGMADACKLLTSTLRYFKVLLRVCRRGDSLYVNGPRTIPAALLAARVRGLKAYYHIHLKHSRLENRLIRLALQSLQTQSLIFASEFIRDKFLEGSGAGQAARKVQVLTNSLTQADSRRPFIDRFGAQQSLCVAIPGTIRPEKGQDIAVWLAGRWPSIEFHIVGRTGEGAEEWTEALRASSPANLHFHAVTPDLHSFVDRLGINVFLIPSRWEEPFGLVAIEGMAYSCLAVVSRTGGLADIASNTGALAFGDEGELHSRFDILANLSSSARSALARGQHAATLHSYSEKIYSQRFGAIVRPDASPTF